MLKIIISPAKKMRHNDDIIDWDQLPIFLNEANEIKNDLSEKTYEELKAIWQCNDKIAQLNVGRLQQMNLTHPLTPARLGNKSLQYPLTPARLGNEGLQSQLTPTVLGNEGLQYPLTPAVLGNEGLQSQLTPAVLAYEGLQYQYMAPQVFDHDQWDYIRLHLKILSGFYGILGATDGITPYRLEMQAKYEINGSKNLYHYWNRKIYDVLVEKTSVIINLASKEYSKAIEPYLDDQVNYITITFGELTEHKGKRITTKATAAKMARGEMVRYMAEYNIKEPEELKAFGRLNYTFSQADSTTNNYVFLKETARK